MTPRVRRAALLAAIAAPVAMVVTELLHELGHLAALRASGASGARLGLVEVAIAPGDRVGAGALLAGPVATGVVGVVAWLVRRSWRRAPHAVASALLWLESLAIAYLCVAIALAPLASSDVAHLLARIDAPAWVALAFVPVGIGLLLGLGGAHQSALAERSGAPRATLLAGWVAILVTQALLLRSMEVLFVACMALAAVAAVAGRRMVEPPRG